MAHLILAPAVAADFERIFDFLFERSPETAADRVAAILQALDVLQASPLIGRPVLHGQRELVIATGASGYLALYRYEPAVDRVRVLAVRSQRERAWRKADLHSRET